MLSENNNNNNNNNNYKIKKNGQKLQVMPAVLLFSIEKGPKNGLKIRNSLN